VESNYTRITIRRTLLYRQKKHFSPTFGKFYRLRISYIQKKVF
jgi:hypothetical protein